VNWKHYLVWPFIFAAGLALPFIEKILEAVDRWLGF
jgi:hypothetical protein